MVEHLRHVEARSNFQRAPTTRSTSKPCSPDPRESSCAYSSSTPTPRDIVTDKVAAAGARQCVSPGTEIVAVTGSFGARVIGTRAEHAIGEHSTIALASRHAPGCDAVVIAVSYDTGLRAARELLAIPVVGMTEAGLLTACMLGGRIGVITFGRRVLPLYHELVASYGLDGTHRRLARAREHGCVPARRARRTRPRNGRDAHAT